MEVFISYKRNATPDHGLALALEVALINAGCRVFRDESAVMGGDQWAKEILRHLRTAEAFIALVSNAALRSGWVVNEIDEALSLRKFIVPVILERLDKDLDFTHYRPRLGNLQHIRYKDSEDGMIHDVLAAIGKRADLGGHVAKVIEALPSQTLGPMYVVKSSDGKISLTPGKGLSPLEFGRATVEQAEELPERLISSIKVQISALLRLSGPLNAAMLANEVRLRFRLTDDEAFKTAVRQLAGAGEVDYLVDHEAPSEGLQRFNLGWRGPTEPGEQ